MDIMSSIILTNNNVWQKVRQMTEKSHSTHAVVVGLQGIFCKTLFTGLAQAQQNSPLRFMIGYNKRICEI